MLKEISIEILRKCPNNCLHCSSCSSIECTETISLNRFKNIIDDGISLGLETVCFSGGEPLLHPNIIEMVDFVHSKNLNSYIYSSGIFIDKNSKLSSIPNDLLRSLSGKVTKIIFNIEAANSETYDLIMGTRDCFELLKQSVINANKLKILTEAHFVPMKVNINQIEDTIELCEEIGISKISFLRLVVHGRAFTNKDILSLNNEDQKKLIDKLYNIKKQSRLNIRIGVPLSDSESNNIAKCEAANGKLNIKYDGFVYPCEVFKNKRINVNNLKPENINDIDIKTIYNNSMYLDYIREFIKNYNGKASCENCVGQYFIQSFEYEGDKNGK